MAGGALAFSVMSALLKLAGETLPLFEIVTGRSLVVSVLSGWAVWRQGHSFMPTEAKLVILRALFGFIALSCYFYAVIHLPLADATVIYFINPVLTALVASVVLREHMGLREVGWVGVSLLAVIVVARPSFLFGAERALDTTAVVLCLVSAFFAAAAYVTIRSMRVDPPLLIVFYFSSVTVLLGAPVVAMGFTPPTLVEVLIVIGVGVATHVGQLWITWGLRMERAGRASAVGYLQIVFAAGWGWLLFSEIPDAMTWVGAAVITFATLRISRIPPIRRGA
jgi:drug/metabolite transporter (DMT)-like permease